MTLRLTARPAAYVGKTNALEGAETLAVAVRIEQVGQSGRWPSQT
ncbi:MAG: hypothetical protein ACREDL_07035 [Bradyrhizobium sp.]